MHDATTYAAMPHAPRLPPGRAAELAPRMFWLAPVSANFAAATSPEPSLKVYLNHGRWVVECPDCHGAQLACYDDHRFLCNECGNVAVAGLWRATVWPGDREAIEAILDHRPPANQNWLPGETIEFLRADNDAHAAVR